MNSDKIGHIWTNFLIYHIRIFFKNNKRLRLQLCFNWWELAFSFYFNFSISKQTYDKFSFAILLCGLFDINYHVDTECDHAGHHFILNILGLHLYYNYEDTRHYDYDNECFIND